MVEHARRGLLAAALLACGPTGGEGGEASSSESTTTESTATPSTDVSIGSTSASTTEAPGTTESGSVDDTGTDTGTELGPCSSTAWVDAEPLVPRDYVGALRQGAPALSRLVFGGDVEGVPYTAVVAGSAVEGPWMLAQQLDAIAPHDIGDIDGDGRDDLVTIDQTGVVQWWATQADGSLSMQGGFESAHDADALLQLPDDPRAAIVRVEAGLSFAHGIGDGTFEAATIIPPPSAELTWSAPVVVFDEAIFAVATTVSDCELDCAGPTFVLQIYGADRVTTIGSLDAGHQLLDVGDIDGDGQLDLLLSEQGTAMLRVHHAGQPSFDRPVLDRPTNDAELSDMDGDGDLDAYSTQGTDYTMQFNHPEQGLSSSSVGATILEAPMELGRAVDLDGNGLTEVVMTSDYPRATLLFTTFCDG